jgi:adenylate cyclase
MLWFRGRIYGSSRGISLATEHLERRLAAVLAADVAGYSRLMGVDEEGTLARLKAVRKALVDPAIASHRGRIVKTTGDGMLVEFASAVDAARCAAEVQRGMAEQSGDIPEDAKIKFRIGIHVGDIIIDENDIFGDGVNIAARLEGIAEAGGVCISDDTHRQIRTKVDFVFDDMGPQTLKNISEPLRAWRMRVGEAPASVVAKSAYSGSAPPPVLPDRPSIAVLPFQNMSGDPEQEYFADGIAEEITIALSRFPRLAVAARNSSFAFKDRLQDARLIGRELGVRYILTGAIRKSQSKVRISTELTDTSTGLQQWAEKYDDELSEIFKLQDLITERVVGTLEPLIRKAEVERALKQRATDLTAYELYLRGRARFHAMSREGLEESLSLFYRALDADPSLGIATALAGVARSYLMFAGWLELDEAVSQEQMRLAQVALDSDPNDPEIVACVARIIAFLGRDDDTAVQLAERSTDLCPNLALAWNHRGWVNMNCGRPAEALASLERALALSPHDPMEYDTLTAMAWACFALHDYRRSVDLARRATQLNPRFSSTWRMLAAALAASDQMDKAVEAARQVLKIEPSFHVSNLRQRFRFRYPDGVRESYELALRAAGLPD